MFIALEGPDGTGKSTLCQILAKSMGGTTAYATPPKKYLELREAIDKSATPKQKYDFYKNGVFVASDDIKSILESGSNVVVDRYWLTTYTYHQLIGVDTSIDDFSFIIKPELTVILTLNADKQLERMQQRGLTTGDKNMLHRQKELSIAYFKNALEFRIPFIIIDTGIFKPEACSEIVIEAIKSL